MSYAYIINIKTVCKKEIVIHIYLITLKNNYLDTKSSVIGKKVPIHDLWRHKAFYYSN